MKGLNSSFSASSPSIHLLSPAPLSSSSSVYIYPSPQLLFMDTNSSSVYHPLVWSMPSAMKSAGKESSNSFLFSNG